MTADAFSALYAETGGVPRKLNTLMNRVLLMGAVEQVDLIDGGLVGAVILDMAGKPFEYQAPMSARAPLVSVVPEPEIVEAAIEHDVEVDAVPDEEPVAEVLIEEPASVMPSPLSLAEPELLTVVDNNESENLAARMSVLEQRLGEQDAALRRVLAMMIDWMDKEQSVEARFMQNSRAA